MIEEVLSMKQEIIINKNPLDVINEISVRHKIKRFMLVCDTAFESLGTFDEYGKIKNIAVTFNSFSSNPLYDEVCEGVKLFKSERCDGNFKRHNRWRKSFPESDLFCNWGSGDFAWTGESMVGYNITVKKF